MFRSRMFKKRKAGAKPIPELLAQYKADMENKTREWCKANNIDYDTTISSIQE